MVHLTKNLPPTYHIGHTVRTFMTICTWYFSTSNLLLTIKPIVLLMRVLVPHLMKIDSLRRSLSLLNRVVYNGCCDRPRSVVIGSLLLQHRCQSHIDFFFYPAFKLNKCLLFSCLLVIHFKYKPNDFSQY